LPIGAIEVGDGLDEKIGNPPLLSLVGLQAQQGSVMLDVEPKNSRGFHGLHSLASTTPNLAQRISAAG